MDLSYSPGLQFPYLEDQWWSWDWKDVLGWAVSRTLGWYKENVETSNTRSKQKGCRSELHGCWLCWSGFTPEQRPLLRGCGWSLRSSAVGARL